MQTKQLNASSTGWIEFTPVSEVHATWASRPPELAGLDVERPAPVCPRVEPITATVNKHGRRSSALSGFVE